MLDIRTIRAHPDAVRQAAELKRIPLDLDRILALDVERRRLIQSADELKARQNRTSKQIATLQGEERERRIKEMQELVASIKRMSEEMKTVDTELEALLLLVPNLPAADVPPGESEADNVEIRRWGTPRQFDFEFKDHVQLGLELGLVDFERAAKMAGSRTYFLRGTGALLELAVLRFALDHIVAKGFVPMLVPHLVRPMAMIGTAYYPGGEEQAYQVERDGLSLIGTSEVPITSYHASEILEQTELPKLYAGWSVCFRREAGTYGKDTRGLFRIHQFQKIEQVVICRNDEEESMRWHQAILRNSEEILQSLDLPYRVVNVCGGDLGRPQVQKFDLETWMPSRRAYAETHSASRFHDFQARRLDLRYRDSDGRVQYCHTLNNTVLASPRILIAILENNQRDDGSVVVPPVLRAYLGGLELLEKPR
ncbi:MAG TPA: serine--tRNA ligase [Candidatus Krumholzibacteria bacterium]|nr:serine--tRNA ligase [Candidatus Krumholzibacteria bacterium]